MGCKFYICREHFLTLYSLGKSLSLEKVINEKIAGRLKLDSPFLLFDQDEKHYYLAPITNEFQPDLLTEQLGQVE